MENEMIKQAVLTIRALYFSIVNKWVGINKEHGLSSAQQYLLFILSTNFKGEEFVNWVTEPSSKKFQSS